MKIKVSFTEEAELDALIRFLSPVIKSYKVAKKQTGQYKRAYIDIDMEGKDDASLQRR